MSIRTDRVAGEIHSSLAMILQSEYRELSDGLLTITKVQVTPDLKIAKVFVSLLGSKMADAAVIKNLENASPELRHALARKLNLRYTPELRFYIDDTQAEVQRVETILQKIARDREQNQ